MIVNGQPRKRPGRPRRLWRWLWADSYVTRWVLIGLWITLIEKGIASLYHHHELEDLVRGWALPFVLAGVLYLIRPGKGVRK